MKKNKINFQLDVRFNENLTPDEAREQITELIHKVNAIRGKEGATDCCVNLRSPIAVTINESIIYGKSNG